MEGQTANPMTSRRSYPSNPSWWSDAHTSGWDRAKEALRRDWEQTKADLSKTKGMNLRQDVGDTVKQAFGKEAIPPGNLPNPPGEKVDVKDWTAVEPSIRYGYGARHYYTD